jgi:hypothetical protein
VAAGRRRRLPRRDEAAGPSAGGRPRVPKAERRRRAGSLLATGGGSILGPPVGEAASLEATCRVVNIVSSGWASRCSSRTERS